MSGRMEVDFQFAKPQMQRESRLSHDDPLRILVLGDFSGRTQRGAIETGEALAQRPILPIDVDNLESRLYGFSPQLQVPIGPAAEGELTVQFRSLDDFHPDRLYQQLEVFQRLRDLRRRLLDPATFAAAAEQLRAAESAGGGPPAAKPAAGGQSPGGGEPGTREPGLGSTSPAENSGSMFERLLGQAPTEQPRVRVGGQQVDVSQLIERLVQPFVVPDAPADQASLVQSVDAALAAQMRELLHDPGFQALESAWRGLWWLVTNVETSDEIKLAMFDVSRDELAADLTAAQTDPTRSGLYQALVEKGVRTPGGQAWSLVAGLYTFGGSAEDLTTLAGLGRVCSQAGGAFVAAANPILLGCRSLVETPEPANWQPDDAITRRWQTLRHSAVARHLGLLLPRFLVRLPYGAASDEIEQFAFEELDERRLHEHLLWGNPALVAAQLLAAAFAESGWQMQPGDVLDVIDLPAYIYPHDGQKKMQACSEVYLSERVGDTILRQGLMPLLSYQNRNAARLMRFQSVADPASGLAVGQP